MGVNRAVVPLTIATVPLTGAETENAGLAVKPLANWLKLKSMLEFALPVTCGSASQLI